MLRAGVKGVDYVVCDTDSHQLRCSSAEHKIQLYMSDSKENMGDGVGFRSIACSQEIANALRGADVIFVAAGLGGFTGTGFAPVVARVARDLGIFSMVSMFTPVDIGHSDREVLRQLSLFANAKSVQPNDCLSPAVGDQTSVVARFNFYIAQAKNVVMGTIGLFSENSIVAIDLEDIRSEFAVGSALIVGAFAATGSHRAADAAIGALTSRFHDLDALKNSRCILVSIRGDESVGLREYMEVLRVVRSAVKLDATILAGSVRDSEMGNQIQVTIIARDDSLKCKIAVTREA
jgi:cell division protein FtsZ